MGVRAQQFVRHAREQVLTLNNLKGMAIYQNNNLTLWREAFLLLE